MVRSMHRKHVPLRTCVACRQTRPKREMVRIVRPPEGGLTVDERGKAAGRGAYLCRSRRCWTLAFKDSRLERALRTAISQEEREMLRAYGERLSEEEPQVQSDA